MIRRNQTDKNIFNDKYALKYRSKQLQENYLVNRDAVNKQTLLPNYDENFKAVSNNKKYHQYKEERELKIKKNQNEVKNEVPKNIAPLSESIYEQKNRDHSHTQKKLLKRQYNYELKQKDQPILDNKIGRSDHEDKFIPSKPQRHEKRNKSLLNFTYNCKTDRLITQTPNQKYEPVQHANRFEPKRTQSFKKFVYPRVEDRLSIKKDRSQNVSIDFAKRRQNSTQYYFKTDYDNTKYVKNHTNKIKLDKILSQAPRLNINPKQTIPQISDLPSSQPSLGAQQVCMKLQQINEFNYQINQRIKSIIGGFESIKNKL